MTISSHPESMSYCLTNEGRSSYDPPVVFVFGGAVNLLVTGGTGFFGGHLVPRLVAAGHRVRVLARGSHRAVLPASVQVVGGDVVTAEGIDAALANVSAVIHLVAVIRERGAYTFERVNHLGTANVVGAMRRCGVHRLLHVSALGATSEPRLRYAFSKWWGEQEVRQSDLHYTIFRPSLLFGSGGGFVDRLQRAVAPMPIFAAVPGSGKTIFQPIWVEDLATCLLLSLSRADAFGQCYEIGGPERLSFDQILDVILYALRLRRIKVHLPLTVLRPMVEVMERLVPDPPITSAELAQLAFDNVCALDAVERSFGFPPARFGDQGDYLRAGRML